MRIRNAKEIYRDFGESLRSDSEELINLVVSGRIGLPLENANYLHALNLTDSMMRHTTAHFRMLTGGAGDGFLGCLKGSLKEMLGRIKANHGDARVIVVNSRATDLESLVAEFPNTLSVIEAATSDRKPIPHFIVADESMLRDEEAHGDLSDDSDANQVRAKVYFANRTMAEAFIQKFDILWRGLSKVTSMGTPLRTAHK